MKMYFKVIRRKTGKCVSEIGNVQSVTMSESVFGQGWIRYSILCKQIADPQQIHINSRTFLVQIDEGGMI